MILPPAIRPALAEPGAPVRAAAPLEAIVAEDLARQAFASLLADEARLSAAARWISVTFLPPGDDPRTPPSVALPAPPGPDDPSAVRHMAEALKLAFARSGLFYESHVLAWTRGCWPLDALRQEPQAALGHGIGADAGSPVPATLEPLVREQLASLATREAVLILVGPGGEPVRLALRPEEQGDAEPSDARMDRAPWSATLRIELPGLGTIEFVLRIEGERVGIAVRAAHETARERLAGAAPELKAALDGQALRLSSFEVTRA